MNEDLFFGFDDLGDDYDYGREIFKEDIYEFHQNLSFPYKKFQLSYIPGYFESKCEDMGYNIIKIRGYFKRGKQTDNFMKLSVKMQFLNEKVINNFNI